MLTITLQAGPAGIRTQTTRLTDEVTVSFTIPKLNNLKLRMCEISSGVFV